MNWGSTKQQGKRTPYTYAVHTHMSFLEVPISHIDLYVSLSPPHHIQKSLRNYQVVSPALPILKRYFSLSESPRRRKVVKLCISFPLCSRLPKCHNSTHVVVSPPQKKSFFPYLRPLLSLDLFIGTLEWSRHGCTNLHAAVWQCFRDRWDLRVYLSRLKLFLIFLQRSVLTYAAIFMNAALRWEIWNALSRLRFIDSERSLKQWGSLHSLNFPPYCWWNCLRTR